MSRQSSPFPSRGKGRGWGEATVLPMTLEDSGGVSQPHLIHSASTPTQPSPLEGEGYLWTMPCP